MMHITTWINFENMKEAGHKRDSICMACPEQANTQRQNRLVATKDQGKEGIGVDW